MPSYVYRPTYTSPGVCSNNVEYELARYRQTWQDVRRTDVAYTATGIEEAVQIVKKESRAGQETHILVTGSLYLVGSFLKSGAAMADSGS